jgi:hypothetical protein
MSVPPVIVVNFDVKSGCTKDSRHLVAAKLPIEKEN